MYCGNSFITSDGWRGGISAVLRFGERRSKIYLPMEDAFWIGTPSRHKVFCRTAGTSQTPLPRPSRCCCYHVLLLLLLPAVFDRRRTPLVREGIWDGAFWVGDEALVSMGRFSKTESLEKRMRTNGQWWVRRRLVMENLSDDMLGILYDWGTRVWVSRNGRRWMRTGKKLNRLRFLRWYCSPVVLVLRLQSTTILRRNRTGGTTFGRRNARRRRTYRSRANKRLMSLTIGQRMVLHPAKQQRGNENDEITLIQLIEFSKQRHHIFTWLQ